MSEQHSPDDASFTGNAKRVLDESVDRLEARLAGRLQRTRYEALASSRRSSWLGWTRGLAAASAVFVVLIFLVGRSDVDHQLQPMLEDDWLAESSTTG
jgi:hypothetical protein